jgi:hypothetical protein
MKTVKSTKMLSIIAVILFATFTAGKALATEITFEGGIPFGWTGVGHYDVLGANGDVTASSPDGGQYGYVSSFDGVSSQDFGFGFGLGDEQNGCTCVRMSSQ